MDGPSSGIGESKPGFDVDDGKKMGVRSKVSKVQYKIVHIVKENFLLLTTIVGVLLGFLVGFIARRFSPTENAFLWMGRTIFHVTYCYVALSRSTCLLYHLTKSLTFFFSYNVFTIFNFPSFFPTMFSPFSSAEFPILSYHVQVPLILKHLKFCRL